MTHTTLKRWMIAGWLAVTVVVRAQSGPPAPPPPPPQTPPAQGTVAVEDYHVGATDVIRIEVLTPARAGYAPGNYTIGVDGAIIFRDLNSVVVAGRTTREIEALLAKQLKDGGFTSVLPTIKVTVAVYRNRMVNVQGEVQKPGLIPVTSDRATLLKALDAADGVRSTADTSVTIVRLLPGADPNTSIDATTTGPGVERQKYDIDQLQRSLIPDPPLQDGDLVYVGKAPVVYVNGEVKRPGEPVVLRPGLTIERAIALVGGFSKLANPDRVTILHKGDTKPSGYINRTKQASFLLAAEDRITVPKKWFSLEAGNRIPPRP